MSLIAAKQYIPIPMQMQNSAVHKTAMRISRNWLSPPSGVGTEPLEAAEELVGDGLGEVLGESEEEGLEEGEKEGFEVGCLVGDEVGISVGVEVGGPEGAPVGA